MSEIAKTLRDRRLAAVQQMREVAEHAAGENRALDATEQGTYEALNEEVDKLDERIKAVLDQEQRAKDADEQFGRIHGQQPEKGKVPDTQAGTQLRAFLRGDGGRSFEVRPEGRVDFRTLSKLTAGAGGNVVPSSFYDRLMAHLIETAGIMRTGPTVLNTTSGEVIQVPKTTAHSSGAIVAEAGTIPASDPAFGQISLGAFKYGVLVQVSRELVVDEGVDLEGYLAMETGRALGNAFGANAITGTGTGQPRGVITDATVGVTGPVGTSTSFGTQSTVGQGGDLIIDLFYSVIEPYRMSQSCCFLMRDATAGTIRKLKASTGDYVWQPSLIPGTPDTILGKPVYSDPTVAAVGVSAKSVAFGDFSQYFVRIAGGIRFERSDDFAFNTDLITYRALLRADGALVDLTGAVKVFVHSAT